MPTQYFSNQSVQVGCAITICDRGEPVSDHTVQFFLCFPLDFRVQCHRENGIQDSGVCLGMGTDHEASVVRESWFELTVSEPAATLGLSVDRDRNEAPLYRSNTPPYIDPAAHMMASSSVWRSSHPSSCPSRRSLTKLGGGVFSDACQRYLFSILTANESLKSVPIQLLSDRKV